MVERGGVKTNGEPGGCQQVRPAADGVHVIEHAVELGGAVVEVKGAGGEGVADFLEDGVGVLRSVGGAVVAQARHAIGGVSEARVVAVHIVEAHHLFVPFFLDCGMEIKGSYLGGALVTVHGHVGVGDVVRKHEEDEGDVVAGGGEGRAFLFVLLDLEVVDDGVREGFAALGQVAFGVGFEGLAVERRVLAGLHEQRGLLQGREGPGRGNAIHRRVLHDVAGTVVFEDEVGVPGAVNDAVAVVDEDVNEAFGERLVFGVKHGVLQPFDGFERDPRMGEFFHDSLLARVGALLALTRAAGVALAVGLLVDEGGFAALRSTGLHQ